MQYQQPNQQPTLPVSPQQVDQTCWIASVPNSIPFNPQFPCSPMMQPYNSHIAGWLIKAIQDNSGKNAVRIFTHNMLSRGGWVNSEFAMAFSATADLAEYLMMTQRRTPQQAIPEAAEQIAINMTAYLWAQYPILQQYCDPNQNQTFAGALQKLQQMTAMIQQYRAQNNGAAQQPGWNQPQQPQGNWYQPQQSNWPQQGQPGNWNQPQQPQPQNGGWSSLPPVLNQQHQPSQAVNEKLRSGRGGLTTKTYQPEPAPEPAPVTASWGGCNDVPDKQPSWSLPETTARRMSVDETFREFAPKPAVEPEPTTTTESVTDGGVKYKQVGDPARPLDYIELDGGTEVVPAHLSNWDRTWSLDAPYDKLFNPNTHMKFHVRALNIKGRVVVNELVRQITTQERSAMEYLQHEIKNRLPFRLDDDKLIVPTDWGRVAEVGEEPIVAQGKDDVPAEVPERVIVTPEIHSVHSYAEASVLFMGDLIEAGLGFGEDYIYEYYYNQVDPLILSKTHIGMMRTLLRTNDLLELASMLDNLQLEGTLDTQLFNTLNRLLTIRINRALSVNCGYIDQLEIDNFVTDIEDLQVALEDRDLLKLWDMINDTYFHDIVGPILTVLTGEEYTKYLNRLVTNIPRDKRGAYQNVLALSAQVSVTHVPWSFHDAINFEPQALCANNGTASFHSAMIALLARTDKMHTPFIKHYVLDNQGLMAEVCRGYLSNDCVIIKLVNLP